MQGEANRVAVVDIGTNSTRLLVADVGRGTGRRGRAAQPGDPAWPRCRPLGPALRRGDRGRLRGDRRIRRVVREAGVGRGRRDRDQRRARRLQRRRLRRRAARALRALGAGARRRARRRASPTSARPPSGRPPTPTLVIDIGGGSTELIVGTGRGDRLPRLPAGGRRPPQRAPRRLGPPGDGRARGARRRRSRHPIEEAAAEMPGPKPTAGIAVAGTPTSLAAVEMGLEPYDSERVHGHTLTLPAIQRLLSRLASVPLASAGDPRPAPGPGADDRRRRRDPGRGDARLRPRADRGLRARHPLRGRDRSAAEQARQSA